MTDLLRYATNPATLLAIAGWAAFAALTVAWLHEATRP